DATDGDASSGPCSSATVLVGTDVVFGKSADSTSQAIDAVGFTVAGAAVARCAWIYVSGVVDASAMTTTIALGVYTNSAGDAPSSLLAHATVVGVVPGWNHAQLDVPLSLTASEDLWLAYSSSAGQIETEVSTTCGPRLYQHTDGADDGGAPA